MLMRSDPFRDLDRLAQQMLGTAARPAAVPIDAWREGEEFVIELDLPGVDPASVDIDVERNVLTIRAERPPRSEHVEMVAAERPRGVFSRQLILGDALDTDKVVARYDGGVLSLRVPIAERAKPRKIEIRGGSSEPQSIEQRHAPIEARHAQSSREPQTANA